MAKETMTKNDVTFVVYPKHLGSGDQRKCLGYAHLPATPAFASEDDAAEWLGEMVERGVFTWKQIASQKGLYNLVLLQFSQILNAYNAATGENAKFIAQDVITAHADDEIDGTRLFDMPYGDAVKAARKIWESEKADPEAWDAEAHQTFPTDVR